MDAPRNLLGGTERSREEQRILQWNSGYAVHVVHGTVGFSVKDTAVDHLQTVRPPDGFQPVAVLECHLADVFDPFPQVAFHHRCAIGKGKLSHGIYRVGQSDLFQLITFFKHVRRYLRHAFRYLACRQVPPVAESGAAESRQPFRQRNRLARIIRIIGLVIRRP